MGVLILLLVLLTLIVGVQIGRSLESVQVKTTGVPMPYGRPLVAEAVAQADCPAGECEVMGTSCWRCGKSPTEKSQ